MLDCHVVSVCGEYDGVLAAMSLSKGTDCPVFDGTLRLPLSVPALRLLHSPAVLLAENWFLVVLFLSFAPAAEITTWECEVRGDCRPRTIPHGPDRWELSILASILAYADWCEENGWPQRADELRALEEAWVS